MLRYHIRPSTIDAFSLLFLCSPTCRNFSPTCALRNEPRWPEQTRVVGLPRERAKWAFAFSLRSTPYGYRGLALATPRALTLLPPLPPLFPPHASQPALGSEEAIAGATAAPFSLNRDGPTVYLPAR